MTTGAIVTTIVLAASVGMTLMWIGIIACATVIGVCVLAKIASMILKWLFLAREPSVSGTPSITSAQLREEGDRRVIGDSWITRRDGILQVYLQGAPFTIGYTSARLTSDLMAELEESLLRSVRQYVRSWVATWLLAHIVMVRSRHLPRYVSDELKMEILGLSRGHTNYHPELGPLFNRLLGYHAGHDIAHSVEDTPLASKRAVEDSPQAIRQAASVESIAGCTAFAAWGSHVATGHVIVGRNCDLEAGPSFDVNKLVSFIRPNKGNAFISVSWCGWLGVATGMSTARLYVSINAAHTSDERAMGTPIALVARDALQYASTLQEAIEIIREAEVFVNDGFLLADGKTGEAVIVEKSPRRTNVLTAGGDFIVSANHFYTPAFADDKANRDFMASSTSVARYERMTELVEREAGGLDVAGAVAILRDRRGKGDMDVGDGNRSTICPIIATHSVVADVTAGIMWVSASPHQLGAFVPFSVTDFGSHPAEAIPADPFLTDGGHARYLESESLLARGEALFRRGHLEEARRALEGARGLNPEYYRAHMLLGELALKEGAYDEARTRLTRAMDRQPPFKRHSDEIQALLARAGKPKTQTASQA